MSYLKWGWTLIIFLVLSLSFPTGCTRNEPLKIGMVAGLSGHMSQLGVSARNAALMAVKEANEKGGIQGRQIKLVIKDNKGDPETCGRVIQELADQGITYIIGPLMSKMAAVVLKTIKDKEILVISPTISTDAVKDIDDNFLRIMPAASLEAMAVSREVLKNGHETAGVVYDASNLAYTGPMVSLFSQQLKQAGKKIIYTNDMAAGPRDKFSRMAREITDLKPHALFLISSGIDAAFLCQQIRKLTDEIQFYGAYWVKTGNILEEGGKSIEGMIVASPYERAVKSGKYTSFARQHRQLFGKKPGFVSIYSYEATQVLVFGIRQSPTPDAKSVKKTILDKREFQGLEEQYTINRYGDAIRSVMLVEVQNNRYVRRD